jgi:hypothetical protein
MTHRKLVPLILAAALSGNAFGDVDCVGIPTQVRTWNHSDQYLSVSLSGYPGPWIICRYDTNFGLGSTPASCKGAQANLLTALAAHRPVRLSFLVYTDCSTIPVWSGDIAFRLWSVAVE